MSNAAAHADVIRRASARVVVFPELSLTGYELDAQPVCPSADALRPIIEAAGATGSVAPVGAPIEEKGRRFIAALRIDGSGATTAYRKSHLGGDELDRFSAGDGPNVIDIDGWRLGMAICEDTGISEHTAGTANLNIDVYVAGLVHLPGELEEQDARGQRIAAVCRSYVAFASFAGPTSGGYGSTAGQSTIWSPNGQVIARASEVAGDVARAELINSEGVA